jgi:type II secretory pathway pseudopilin PulG
VRHPRLRHDEAGETLIEVLLTIMVVGIGMTALIAGMTIAIVSSDAHRRLGDTEVITRDYGEAVKLAALHPVTTTLTQSIGAHMPGDPETFTVANASRFPSAPFGVSIDTEEFAVIAVVGTTVTATALGSEGHNGNPAQGPEANVTRYDACPTLTQLQPRFALPTGTSSGQFRPPSISKVAFFYSTGQPPSGQSLPAGITCSGFWNSSSTGTTQGCALIGDHLTQCDPQLIRVTFSVSSLDSDTRRFATTFTEILLRRGNA